MHRHTDPTSCECLAGLYARELSHRTGNVLQSAMAAVHLARRAGPDLLEDAMSRLSGAAELTGLLGPAKDATPVDAARLVEATCRASVRTHGATAIAVDVRAEPLLADAERCRRALAIAAELVGNSIRHAFPERRGTIAVALLDDGEATTLVVEDDGTCRGWGRPGGQGRGIVDALADSLGGKVERSITASGSSRIAVTTPTLAAAVDVAGGA